MGILKQISNWRKLKKFINESRDVKVEFGHIPTKDTAKNEPISRFKILTTKDVSGELVMIVTQIDNAGNDGKTIRLSDGIS